MGGWSDRGGGDRRGGDGGRQAGRHRAPRTARGRGFRYTASNGDRHGLLDRLDDQACHRRCGGDAHRRRPTRHRRSGGSVRPGTRAETPPRPSPSAWPRQSATCRASGAFDSDSRHSRPLVAQPFGSRALPVRTPEKPEALAFWPPEVFFAVPRRSPGGGIRGRQESPAELAEALAWLADLGNVAADRICLTPRE